MATTHAVEGQLADGVVKFTTTAAGIPNHFWSVIAGHYPPLELLRSSPLSRRNFAPLSSSKAAWSIHLPQPLSSAEYEGLATGGKTAKDPHIELHLVMPADDGVYNPYTAEEVYYAAPPDRYLRHVIADPELPVPLDAITLVLKLQVDYEDLGDLPPQVTVQMFEVPAGLLQRWRDHVMSETRTIFGVS